jgi:hypothetical protein
LEISDKTGASARDCFSSGIYQFSSGCGDFPSQAAGGFYPLFNNTHPATLTPSNSTQVSGLDDFLWPGGGFPPALSTFFYTALTGF